ncbi:MAG: hypothetical protein ABIB97_05635 [Patescibacteria group bacterium]
MLKWYSALIFVVLIAISIVSLLDLWEDLMVPAWLNYVVIVLAVIGLIMAATSKKGGTSPVQQ